MKNWTRVDKLVVTRYNKNGEPMIAKPCRVCQRVIKFAGINTVEHT
jgi:hypothetical protein